MSRYDDDGLAVLLDGKKVLRRGPRGSQGESSDQIERRQSHKPRGPGRTGPREPLRGRGGALRAARPGRPRWRRISLAAKGKLLRDVPGGARHTAGHACADFWCTSHPRLASRLRKPAGPFRQSNNQLIHVKPRRRRKARPISCDLKIEHEVRGPALHGRSRRKEPGLCRGPTETASQLRLLPGGADLNESRATEDENPAP